MAFETLYNTSWTNSRHGDNGPTPILILDGGMGTTLESLGKNISDTPLWSASVIQGDPDTVVRAHSEFIHAGADIIITNTYQAAFETFDRAGVPRNEVPDILLKGVELASEARKQHLSGSDDKDARRPWVALSIGSYGSTLPSAEEYDGSYPPPFGPQGVSSSSPSPNTNVFNLTSTPATAELQAEAAAEKALAEWHLSRLRVYASREETWSQIDCIAFETVPLLREARAIRWAVHELFVRERVPKKPWWITFTFPQGEFPEEQYRGGPKVSIDDIVEACFLSITREGLAEDEVNRESLELDLPSAIGVNCTALTFVPNLSAEFSKAVTKRVSKGSITPQKRPWLVVYPNAGLEYIPNVRKWREVEEQHSVDWANDLVQAVTQPLLNSTEIAWGGIILGGCCRIGPDNIHRLRTLVSSRDING